MSKYGEAMETMMRMETALQGSKGRREKPNKSSNISSRDMIHCSLFSLSLFFPFHTLKKECRAKIQAQQQKVQLCTFLVCCIIPSGVSGKLILFVLFSHFQLNRSKIMIAFQTGCFGCR